MSKVNSQSLALVGRPKGRIPVVPICPDVAAVNGLVDQLYAACIESSKAFRLIESGNARACSVKIKTLISAMVEATANAQIIQHELAKRDDVKPIKAIQFKLKNKPSARLLPPAP